MVTVHMTPEVMLGAPRRTPAVPNRTGQWALYSVSTHAFGSEDGEGKPVTTAEVRVVAIPGAASESGSDDGPTVAGAGVAISAEKEIHDVNWLPGTDDSLVMLRSGEDGGTTILIRPSAGDADAEAYVAGEVDAGLSTVKLAALEDGSVAFVAAALASPDGESLVNEKKEAKKKRTTGRVFDTAHVRSWNMYYKENTYALWYARLTLTDGKWALASLMRNALAGAPLDAPFGMYDDLLDPLSSYDVGPRGIAFMARDLTNRDVAFRMTSVPYFTAIDSFAEPPSGKPRRVSFAQEDTPCMGAGMTFTPEGNAVAFISCKIRNFVDMHLFLAPLDTLVARDVLDAEKGFQASDHGPPSGFKFAGSADVVILHFEKVGRTVLSRLELGGDNAPELLTREGSVLTYYPLREGDYSQLLVSSSSFVDSSLWQIVSDKGKASTLSSLTEGGAVFGISKDMFSEIWWEGSDGIKMQAFVAKPSDFDEKKTYPWVFLPHGGPVSSWRDAWMARWNMATLAQMGYVIILPNITGSTGFGVDFANRINGEWGGRPVEDLKKLLAHLETLPYLDQTKAVLAGASYSGYLVSYLFADDIITKFCAAVWHDGVYSVPTSVIQDDWFVDDGSLGPGGPFPWLNAKGLAKWNPAQPERLAKWHRAPPTVICHSEKDYRCPITEGLGVFHTLQAQGVPSQFLTFPDEGHWVLSPENSLFWYETVWGWVQRCVDGEIKRGDKTW